MINFLSGKEIIMNLKEFCTGVQHIGIPTENIEQTILFYEGLGFDKLYDTYKKNGEQKVVFLQLGNLIIETYEEENISKNDGIINHIAIDCSKIYEVYNILKNLGFDEVNEKFYLLKDDDEIFKFFKYEVEIIDIPLLKIKYRK